MKKLFTLLFILTYLFCSSQKTIRSSKLEFQSLNQIGFVYGEASSEPIVQSINGMLLRTFFIGAGVGLDYYKQRSLPIFLDIRKNLLHKPQTPFIYLDGGYHFELIKEEPEDWISKGYKGGLYYDMGIGYTFPLFHSSSIMVSLGYSSKEMTEERNRNPWRSSPAQAEDFETLEYKLRRYSFKMGLAF